MGSGTVSATEVGKFDRLASRWWDPNGPMQPLHRMNPARVGWIEGLLRGPTRILDVGCGAGLAAEAQDAAASGFALKACIHPTQAAVVRRAFQPGKAQVAWARRVLAAARDSGDGDKGAVKLDGQMIDAPLIRQAEAVLAAAGQESADT